MPLSQGLPSCRSGVECLRPTFKRYFDSANVGYTRGGYIEAVKGSLSADRFPLLLETLRATESIQLRWLPSRLHPLLHRLHYPLLGNLPSEVSFIQRFPQ